MKTLSIQIQPDRLGLKDVEGVVKELSEIATKHGATTSVSEGIDSARYVNIDLETHSVLKLWDTLKPEFAMNEKLAHSAIVCCEGESGWDDYLLLHHFDSSLILDSL